MATDPTLSFNHIYETDSTLDDGFIEVFTSDTGQRWRLGGIATGTNWYDASDGWNGTSGSASVWRSASHVLTGTAGSSIVRIRHRLTTSSFGTGEGFGFDDVAIAP